jgi:hypothetical protein
MTLAGANPKATMAGLEELPGKSNYFIGRDPARWHTNVPNYRRVALNEVYPGIGLVYYGNQGQLEYDFVVAPGADPQDIRLVFETADSKIEKRNSKLTNAESPIPNRADLRIAPNGDLVVQLAAGEVRLHKPLIYQSAKPGSRTPDPKKDLVDGRFVLLATNRVGFEVGGYDRTRPLIIDPVLSYSTYLGGGDIDVAKGVAVGIDGTVFLVGQTDSIDFPTAHALQPNVGGPFDFPDDAFVAKISADGATLLYSTFLGGNQQEIAHAIAVDSFGAAYVTGTTISQDFPATIGAPDPNCGNDGRCDSTVNNGLVTSDAFMTKLNPEGSAIEYSSFFSHRGALFVDANGNPVLDPNGNFQYLGANDRGLGIAVDQDGKAYMTGTTDYPEIGPYAGFGLDAFLVVMSATGSDFLLVEDLGGSLEDQAFAVAADRSGNAYLTGITYSSDFPRTASAFQASNRGNGDAFLAKFNTTTGVLSYSTFLGGNGSDRGNGLAVDLSGRVYVTGVTSSSGVPFPTTAGVLQGGCRLNTLGQCDGDAFVTELDTTQIGAASLVVSTYVGGTGADTGLGIAVDTSGNMYVTGFTNSPDFPVVEPTAFQQNYGGGNTDAFVSKLDPTATTLTYSSFLGGSNAEEGSGIAVDRFANAYVAGQTCSTDFPTKRPFQESSAGNCDAFVSKVLVGPDIAISPATLSFTVQSVGTTSTAQTITVTSNGDSPLTISGVAISGEFAETDNCSGATLGVGATCTIDVTFSPTTPGPKSGTVTITDNALGSPHTLPLSGGISGVAGDFSLSIDPTSTAVVAGGTASYLLTITPAAGYNARIDLSCTGAPRAATCSVSPSSVTLNGADPSTATISVSTAVRTLAPPGSGPSILHPGVGGRWLPWILALLLMATLVVSGRRRALLALGMVTLLVLTWSACAGGSMVGVPRGTPAGTYNLTITGAAGSVTHSTTVNLTVQ